MPIFRTDRNQAWDSDGNLVHDEEVQVDVTIPAAHYDLHARLREFLIAPPEDHAVWLAALTRLLLHVDGASDPLESHEGS